MTAAEHRLRWRRIGLAVLAGEALPILLLVLLVMMYGALVRRPGAPTPEVFAQHAGLWVGPIAGAVVAFGAAWWAGRASRAPVLQAVVIGAGIAILDLTILTVMGEPFRLLFWLSNAVKVVAALLGGILVARRGSAETR